LRELNFLVQKVQLAADNVVRPVYWVSAPEILDTRFIALVHISEIKKPCCSFKRSSGIVPEEFHIVMSKKMDAKLARFF
jgi:hypothetical protein